MMRAHVCYFGLLRSFDSVLRSLESRPSVTACLGGRTCDCASDQIMHLKYLALEDVQQRVHNL